MRIIDFTGLPQHFPLAIVVWGDLDMLHGMPTTDFKLEDIDFDGYAWRSKANMYVARNAAAANLKV